ncbi:MAG: Hsp70 family protein [Pseudonocardiaceae bacterium]
MGVTVGIDLGTTNSCVAVLANAEIPGMEGLIDRGRLRRVGQALVITDEDLSPVTPSAVWLDPDGKPVVGVLAKARSRLPGEPPPAMFFKRSMGTDQQFTAGHARLSAQEASTHLLRYLKEMAEGALGVPVDRAIVTVPAFFETAAKNATTRAGAAAGLEIVQTLLEPVAAALTYVYDRLDTLTEPGTFLVYDLGGGTFDASVVCWDPEGDFDHRSFHGDRFLGGYDFDQAIVRWVAAQLPRFDLAFNDADETHLKLLNTLLVDAEIVKIELSRTPIYPFARQGVNDCAGKPMLINLPVRRQTFHELIDGQIRHTTDLCDRALELAGVAPGSLNEVVMVGGSSRIPLVSELLEQRYGRRPLLTDPDLCVGIGAALKTASLIAPSAYLELARPVPAGRESDIGGKLRTGPRLSSPAKQLVILTSDDGQVRRRQHSTSDGTFQFVDVPLAEGENDFTIQLMLAGEPIDTQTITIVTDAPPMPETHAAILTKDFFLSLKEGPLKVAEAGTKVPHNGRFSLYTATQGDLLVITVVEGRTPIGEVTIADLPRDLEVGTPVEVQLHFTDGWEIEAEARVPSVHRSASAVMRIREAELDSWEELQRRLQVIDAVWQDKKTLLAPATRIEYGPRFTTLRQEVADLLNQRTDRAKANYKLTELETVAHQVPILVGTSLKPSMSEFEDDLELLAHRCGQLAAAKGEQRAAEFRDGIPGLRTSGLAAYEAGNQQLWARAAAAVSGQIYAIDKILRGDGPGSGTVSADYLQLVLRQRIDGKCALIRQRNDERGGKYRDEAAQLLAEGDRIERIISSVDVRDAGALVRLRQIEVSELQKWSADVADFPPKREIELTKDRS